MGPRPALPNEVATYNDYQRQRLLAKPGMTCYWQTRRNRDSITFDEWVDLDLWAEGGVSNMCFGPVGAVRRHCDHLSSKTKLTDCGGRHVVASLCL